jgi:hypothetical protein
MCGESYSAADLRDLQEMGEQYYKEKGFLLCPDCWDLYSKQTPEDQLDIAVDGKWRVRP